MLESETRMFNTENKQKKDRETKNASFFYSVKFLEKPRRFL